MINSDRKTAQPEMEIRCPVCGEPRVFIDGEIRIDRQISFHCFSRKCGGKRRYINKEYLQKIVDNFNHHSI